MNEIFNILLHIPWWVFVLFLLLMRKGVKALKDTELTLKGLLILPTIFSLLLIDSLFISEHNFLISLILCLVGVSIGAAISYKITPIKSTVYDFNKQILIIKGSYYPLFIISFMFIIKFTLGYKLATNPNVINNIYFAVISHVSSGVFTGFSLMHATLLARYFLQNKKLQSNPMNNSTDSI